ncbi:MULTISPECIES: hypothetical protein [Streptomyces]|uniref:Uncharacterized protein n=2 Tax=Streptomyces rimosus subsp. rimosus TaxID=132474 RepID=L8EPL1_STRR1|nr:MULTISPECIES: hypothetical protein [Streptomyces]KOG73887.1 hypothetical protein ADK78_15025 [Kitasatospora aureofaciens]MYT46198.1 hypothetical protein [Streptomyces sp. SID5471]KEF04193.1 hypothetical protein DF17_24645 [Streptomyces rimosus]KEF21748.1 hypothetical protein DF18_06385 [Streptomyces rimosus]KOT37422.1 hypothetical protein ADK84_17515 [Streptomyces sp. NRRL WC-3701]
MGRNQEYGVDLDALDQVVKELNHVLKEMGTAQNHSKNSTYLPQGALGENFKEAPELYHAHDKMKTQIEGLVDLIEKLVNQFGEKSHKTRGAYQDAEAENKVTMG